MSRAFVKEPDETAPVEDLPERPVGNERNLVTPRGLGLIEAEITRLAAALSAAQQADDPMAVAVAGRDLRYWTARRASAETVPPVHGTATVRFGLTVTLENEQGAVRRYRIVGIDEADPAQGLLSYVSPLATALLGKQAGATARIGENEWEIAAIEPSV